MDASQQLDSLIDLCEELGIAIRKAPAGDGLGASGHPGGAVVRSLHNPFGKGFNVIFAGGSDSAVKTPA